MATLYEYYKKLGKNLPSVSARANVASQAGIKNYSGTEQENQALLSYLSKPQTATQNITNQTRQGVVDQNTLTDNPDDEVIGAGPNAGMTVGEVARRDAITPPTFTDTNPSLTRRAGETASQFAERIRNQPFTFAGGESANMGLTLDEVNAQKSGVDNINIKSVQEKGTGAVTNTTKGIIANKDAIMANVGKPRTASVVSYKDNPDGTTTNYLSDGTTSTVRYTKNADGSLQPVEVNDTPQNTVDAYYKKFGLQSEDGTVDSIINNKVKQLQSESETPIDEEAVRRSFKQRIQASLDAINQTYASMLGRAKIQGENNQGVNRAISARSGLLGSSFDEANVANIGKANVENQNSIEAERMALLSEALNSADDKATSYISQMRKDREEANTKLMDTILTRETRTAGKASKLAQYLITQGFNSLDELSPADKENIAKNFGVDPQTLAVEFDKALTGKKTSDLALDKDRYVSISDGSKLYDKQTGKIIENTKNYAPKAGTGTTTGYGVDANGNTIRISSSAQTWIDKINRDGGKPSDYITGTSKEAQALRNEVQAGLNAQGGVGSFDKAKNIQLIDVVDDTIKKLSESKDLVGTFRTRNADSKWLNWTSNKNTSFVNQVDKLQGQLLKLDGVALKAIFGPQISNADAQTIKEIVGNALDPKNQTPEDFQQSLDDITRGLNEYRKNNSVAPVTVDTGEEYNYTRDLQLAQDAIARGANEAQVMARFHAKYK